MAKHNVQGRLHQDPSYLDPERPESWGETTSTAPIGCTLEELPVRLSVLVQKNRFAGFTGPRRVRDAILDYYVDRDIVPLRRSLRR